MSKRPLMAALALVAVLAPSAPDAQPLRPDRPVSVTVRMSTSYPIGPGADETALQQQARAAFYKAAAGECRLISDALTGDCALLQVNVSTRRMEARVIGGQPAEPTIAAEGTMSFALTPSLAPSSQ